MATPIANVNVSLNTWGQLISRVNDVCFVISNSAVTTAANSTGGLTSGNGYVTGIFGSNTLFATTALRGGSVTASANLNITSNTVFSGTTIQSSANVSINAISTFTGNVSITGATAIVGNVAVTGQSTFTANVSPTANGVSLGLTAKRWEVFANSADIISLTSNTISANILSVSTVGEISTYANTNLGATGAKVLASYAMGTYRSGTISITGGTPVGDYQRSDILFIHNGVDVYYTTSGIVYSNSQFFSIDSVVNGANVDIRVTPTIANVSIKLLAQLTKG